MERMRDCLRHRGPDDRGIFVRKDGVVALANTRLAIIDLSAAGHQPMSSGDGRLRIVFNGEIYNFAQLRAELEEQSEVFVSSSDTEVVLKMYQRYGPDCVRELEGMFALAIWDERLQSCFLARGPLGVKPLYYSEQDETLVFASEVRALLSSDLVPRTLSSRALNGYFLFGAVPEPDTLIEDVFALPPGHHATWSKGRLRLTRYWSLNFDSDPVTEAESAAILRDALTDSVSRHLVSDVPVGIFLSGGIDSTALVALASQSQKSSLRTFCISFDDPAFDEGKIAARTAAHFGTEHFDWRLDSTMAKSLLNEFLLRSDQPSIDGFNTFCVARHAHEHETKVVLAGLGGDELFGGYPSFKTVPRMVRISRTFNFIEPVRRGLGSFLERSSPSLRERRLGRFLQGRPTTFCAYQGMRGIFTPRESSALIRHYLRDQTSWSDEPEDFHIPFQPTLEDEVSYLEVMRYMRNQLLRDTDVMSMAWGLELRVPFVDAKLISSISRLPARIRLAPGKQLLLSAVPEIPEWVRNRPKRGFTFPFRSWIAGEWRPVFERIEAQSPIRLQSWYRRWCLFALESFIERNQIQVDGLARPA